MMRVRTLIELVRAPAALTVPGDVVAGTAATRSVGRTAGGRILGSCLLYWAGMALNDYADRRVDTVERPRRPIPSGRVSPATALSLSIALTGASVARSCWAGGRRELMSTLPLAATVWGYNLGLKNTFAGPATMATARALDVLYGAGPGNARKAAFAATTVGIHTFAVSTVARSEVAGSRRRTPTTALAATFGITAAMAARQRATGTRATPAAAALGTGALAVYLATVGRAQLDAIGSPDPTRLQRATGAGILGMIPLQAALTAVRGDRPRAAALLGVFPIARELSRRVSPT